MEYRKWEDGKIKRVLDFDECIESLKERNADQNERIERLVEENKHLKSEHYKDDELQALKDKYTTLQEDSYRGFPITKLDERRIDEWKYTHEMQEHSRPSYSYIFTPTALGLVGVIRCSCGAEFDFSKLK